MNGLLCLFDDNTEKYTISKSEKRIKNFVEIGGGGITLKKIRERFPETFLRETRNWGDGGKRNHPINICTSTPSYCV
jgi:hypothetical protein